MNILKKINRKIYKFFHPKLGVILMLHRVLDERSQLKINRDIEITADFLEQTIQAYQSKSYRFISMDDLEAELNRPFWIKKKPFVIFTFDDGYIDNYAQAYPIFKKYNCPFTIYITTDFPDYKANLWWYILDDLLMKNDLLKLSDGSMFQTRTIDEKNEAFKAIHLKISCLEPELLKSTFDDWFSDYDYSFENKVKDLSMTHNQIKELSEDNLCCIGSHTVSHPRLENMNFEQQRNELSLSKAYLEKLIGKEVNHFAYPFGSHNDMSVQLAESCGYKSAVIAWGGVCRKGQNKWRLTREILKQN